MSSDTNERPFWVHAEMAEVCAALDSIAEHLGYSDDHVGDGVMIEMLSKRLMEVADKIDEKGQAEGAGRSSRSETRAKEGSPVVTALQRIIDSDDNWAAALSDIIRVAQQDLQRKGVLQDLPKQ